jgi:hypothetical protein
MLDSDLESVERPVCFGQSGRHDESKFRADRVEVERRSGSAWRVKMHKLWTRPSKGHSGRHEKIVHKDGRGSFKPK